MTRSRLVDIEVTVHHETEKAILVSDDGDRENAVWLPLSAVEVERGRRGRAIITLPEHLALDRGLI